MGAHPQPHPSGPWRVIAVATNVLVCAHREDSPFHEAGLESPSLVLLAATEGHWPTLRPLLQKCRIAGTAVHEAHIAALCLRHGVRELWPADRDFWRFPALRVVNPLPKTG